MMNDELKADVFHSSFIIHHSSFIIHHSCLNRKSHGGV